MSDRHIVVLAGWNVGLRTIDLIKLVRGCTPLSLAEAKSAVERLVDGEQMALTFRTTEEAQRFVEDAVEAGAIAHFGS